MKEAALRLKHSVRLKLLCNGESCGAAVKEATLRLRSLNLCRGAKKGNSKLTDAFIAFPLRASDLKVPHRRYRSP